MSFLKDVTASSLYWWSVLRCLNRYRHTDNESASAVRAKNRVGSINTDTWPLPRNGCSNRRRSVSVHALPTPDSAPMVAMSDLSVCRCRIQGWRTSLFWLMTKIPSAKPSMTQRRSTAILRIRSWTTKKCWPRSRHLTWPRVFGGHAWEKAAPGIP